MKKSKIGLSSFIALMRAANRVSGLTSLSIKKSGLTVSQFGVLEALYHHKQLSNKQLSQKILKGEGNLTMVVDNLAKQDLVKKSMNPADRRAIYVELTNKGSHLIEKYLPKHLEYTEKIMHCLTETEKKQLINICPLRRTKI